MTELEKLEAGLPYCFTDPDIEKIKKEALRKCQILNAIDILDVEKRTAAIKDLFGSVGEDVSVFPNFNCDNGKNIHVGEHFLMNYNGIILDVAEVRIGHHVMIGPNTMITTVNHPLTPQGRRDNLGIAKPVIIGNDVWIGGNVTILPGVTIGNNVVVAAGAVVTKNVPDNYVVAGVPAKLLKTIENDVEN
ncbi:sugar O-acetyltransferase [Streptococcus equinus]|uniref:sugar O-acetyltransferase n=1 Tax=Streptococcus equinus TaxID=1335 RepID=UPI0008DF462D|nr:sugar O-acetyltransferase [Streptococcus equinus]SFB81451.1 maltose O-acetyltransferase [Streptococcus equinus]